MEDKYQRDMDRVRVTDVDYLATLVADYLKKTGTLPLSSKIDDKDIEVFITHREIPQSILEQAAKLPIRIMPVTDLKSELEAGLKKDIKLPSDPHRTSLPSRRIFTFYTSTRNTPVLPGIFTLLETRPGTSMASTINTRDVFRKMPLTRSW